MSQRTIVKIIVIQVILAGLLCYESYGMYKAKQALLAWEAPAKPVPISFRESVVKVLFKDDASTGCAIAPFAIITNYHTIINSLPKGVIVLEAFTTNGYKRGVGRVVSYDIEKDIAVIMTGADMRLIPAKMATREPEWGAVVTSVGCPMGVNAIPTRGFYGERDGSGRVIITCDGFFGNSGGPLFNEQGEVVAITQGMFEPVQATTTWGTAEIRAGHLLYCVPYDQILEHLVKFMDQHKKATEQ